MFILTTEYYIFSSCKPEHLRTMNLESYEICIFWCKLVAKALSYFNLYIISCVETLACFVGSWQTD